MEHHNSQIKSINGLLNTQKTRVLGLKKLNSYLSECSDDEFTEYCINWMQNCCKSDELNRETELAIQTLRWDCARNCFSFYRGPCGPSQDIIQKHLNSLLVRNEKISDEISDCCALLPSLGGGGNDAVNYKTNWKNQFQKFIQISHSVLNDLFNDIDELQEYDTEGNSYTTEKKEFDYNYLVIQLYNNCKVLSSMLLGSYPAVKCISTEIVIELICRGLAVTPKGLRKVDTNNMMSLRRVLPQIHIILLEVLKSLIATCGNQLLPYSHLLCKLMKQTLEWTKMDFPHEKSKDLTDLRISTYTVACVWLVAAKSGGCMDTVAREIISHITWDIEGKASVVLLKETKSTPNTSTKKKTSGRRTDQSVNDCLCFSALTTLQFLLKFCGVLIKSDEHKHLQEAVIRLLVDIQKSFPSDIAAPYSASKCRKALYSVLVELVNQPCPTWPPPTNFALRLLRNGQNDTCPDVSLFCSAALNALTVIIHYQFSNGPYWTADNLNGHHERDVSEREEPMDVDLSSRDELMDVEQEATCDGVISITEEDSKESELEQDIDNEKRESTSAEVTNDPSMTLEAQATKDLQASKVQGSCTIEILEEDSSEAGSDPTETNIIAIPDVENKIDMNENTVEPANKKSKIEEETEGGKAMSPQNSPTSNKVSSPQKSPNSCKVSTPQKSPTSSKVSTPVKTDSRTDDEASKSPKNVSTPEKDRTQGTSSSDSPTDKNVTPEMTAEDAKYLEFKKRYNLRSKGKGASEEPEEPLRRRESVDSPRQTPTRTFGRSTPLSVNRRPRTRALSKLEENELELGTPKKGGKEDEDIIEAFDDTLAE
ncbi:hypothetical protein RUM43_007851 [Polyplax serrata]|uniref:Uncharacterized protein n=1 Tax=Polyplax serrata TaxID=468196 RepID=A0AAN8PMT3_POLSC